MVYTGASEERTRVVAAAAAKFSSASAAAMNNERAAKPLHNFSLPWDLKWGNQRHLRCMKVEDSDEAPAPAFDRRSLVQRRGGEPEGQFERRSRPRRPRIDSAGGDGDEAAEGIDAVREKLMFEFKKAADKMKDAILKGEEDDIMEVDDDDEPPAPAAPTSAVVADVAEEDEEEEEGEAVAAEEGGSSPAAATAVRPWNLRKRRAACKAPPIGGKSLRIEERNKTNYSPLRSEGGNNGGKSPRLVRGAASGSGLEKKDRPKERPKFSLTLSKKEIEEDFIQMLGHRPPRRPKKRPRAVQKQLDALFPGMWLTEVSADSYKVPEFPENVKR